MATKNSKPTRKARAKNIDGFKKPTKKHDRPSDVEAAFLKDVVVSEEQSSNSSLDPSSLEDAIDGFANADYDDVPKDPKDYRAEDVPVSAVEDVPVSVEKTTVIVTEGDFTDDTSEDRKSTPAGQNNTHISEPETETETESEPEAEAAEAAEITIKEVATEKVEDEDIEDLINDVASKTKSDEKESVTSSKKGRKMDKLPKKAKPYRIISRILAIITTIALGTFITYASLSNAIPFKYVAIIIGVGILFSGFYLFKSFRKKTHLSVLTILNILGVALSIASIFGFVKFNELLSFLDNNLGGSDIEYSVYDVIVSKKSSYNSLDDVKGMEFHSISDFIDTQKLEKAVSEQVSGTVVYADGITSMLQSSIKDPTYISLLNAGTWDATTDADADKEQVYKNSLKIIGEIKVPVEQNTRTSTANITKDAWIMYISGIDTRSGMMVDRSLSDVNIVMTVNPTSKHILMVAIPRDYYVQLHGTSGLPDKLTHAGSLGGLALSMATIDDLLDINIEQYLRVNFNAVIGLVNAIGGITVNSDVDYSFHCHTNNSCVINPGLNNLDGDCALAFARERYAYSSGDRHRGENQEQVIEKIFDKISSSTTLISKYSEILKALSGSFETSLTTSDITSLVNMQLNDMAKWTIETYNLNGTTGGAYTYSYPNQTLSVMFPDANTINIAKNKIKAVLNGASASSVSSSTNN
ncbi:LCP family protein [Candidatus Saccharibacteria bacterium]|nr:LCP family protein [Candidatus Saccharibacteria bacterium]